MDKCPNCGYTEPTNVKRMTNHMNLYVHDDTGKVYGMMNNNEDYLTVGPAGKTIRVRRQDVKVTAKVTSAPTVVTEEK